MKKMMALLLAVLLMIGLAGSSLAYDDEITFQGIPWGQDRNEVEKYLLENDIYNSSLGEIPMPTSSMSSVLVKDKKLKVKYESLDAKDKEIFGRDIIVLKSIGGYENCEGVLTYVLDGEVWKLYLVSVRFELNNPEDAYNDLCEKLNTVYGERGKSKNGKMEYSYWLGANDTAVVLIRPTNGYVLDLCYTTITAKDMFQQAIEHYQVSIPANQVENTTEGL